MIIKVKNNKETADTWLTKNLAPGAEYTLLESERSSWASNTKVLIDVTAGGLGVGDGTTYFATASQRVDWLKGNNLPIGSITGGVKVTAFKPETFSTTIVTHDWCDKTTWYPKSVRVTDEVLTTLDSLLFSSAHEYWIDLTHGKVYDEDAFSSAYSVVVKVDDVVQTSGFTVNYVTGKVTFNSTQSGTVKATYSYATNSTWILTPSATKKIMIEHTELQFAKNVQMISGQSLDFEIWVYNPADLPNKVMYAKNRYKNMKDIVNAANIGYAIPAFDIFANDIIILPFEYASLKALKSSQGAEVRIKLSNDIPLVGEWGTCTFYAFIDPE